jgi:hypothetical protein
MRNRTLYYIAAVTLFATASPSFAQQPADSAKNDRTFEAHEKVERLVPKHYYRLNYVLRETEDGRTLNQRTFVVTINPEVTNAQGEVVSAGDPRWWSVRAGTRVPYSTSSAEGAKYSYADVGVNLDSRGFEFGEALQLEVSSEISSLGTESQPSSGLPVIRQLKVRSAVLAPFGKPTMVFTADDPASKHRFELEVTPVRER